jgi:rhomboid protease GluP
LALPYRWQTRIERWKNSLRGFFSGGEQQPRPKLCPSCGALVGISATRCHECGTSLRFSMAAATRGLSGLGLFAGPAPVTSILLVVNLLMFGVSWLATVNAGTGSTMSSLWGMNGEVLARLGWVYGPWIWGGDWYRLVTGMFLHGGLIHIGVNMMSLMNIGPVVEEVYGSARYLFLYVTTGIFGFVVSSFNPLHAPHPTVGASGALVGLVGVLLALTTKRGGAYMKQLRSQLVSSIALLFVIGFIVPIIDNSAHFGGLVAWFVLGLILNDREPMNVKERNVAYALGWTAGIVVIASFVFMLLHFSRPIG